MSRKFDEKFNNLINHDIPRSFMRNPDGDNSDIPAECPTLAGSKFPEPSADGFIATYCCKDGK